MTCSRGMPAGGLSATRCARREGRVTYAIERNDFQPIRSVLLPGVVEA